MDDRAEPKPSTAKRGRPSLIDSAFENHRNTITRLWHNEGRKLSDVIRFMKTQHGFLATPKQYKDRLKVWGLQKNIRNSQMPHLARIKVRRDAICKRTRFRLRDIDIRTTKIDRWIKTQKKNLGDDGFMSLIQTEISTPPEIVYDTEDDGDSSSHPKALDESCEDESPPVASASTTQDLCSHQVPKTFHLKEVDRYGISHHRDILADRSSLPDRLTQCGCNLCLSDNPRTPRAIFEVSVSQQQLEVVIFSQDLYSDLELFFPESLLPMGPRGVNQPFYGQALLKNYTALKTHLDELRGPDYAPETTQDLIEEWSLLVEGFLGNCSTFRCFGFQELYRSELVDDQLRDTFAQQDLECSIEAFDQAFIETDQREKDSELDPLSILLDECDSSLRDEKQIPESEDPFVRFPEILHEVGDNSADEPLHTTWPFDSERLERTMHECLEQLELLERNTRELFELFERNTREELEQLKRNTRELFELSERNTRERLERDMRKRGTYVIVREIFQRVTLAREARQEGVWDRNTHNSSKYWSSMEMWEEKGTSGLDMIPSLMEIWKRKMRKFSTRPWDSETRESEMLEMEELVLRMLKEKISEKLRFLEMLEKKKRHEEEKLRQFRICFINQHRLLEQAIRDHSTKLYPLSGLLRCHRQAWTTAMTAMRRLSKFKPPRNLMDALCFLCVSRAVAETAKDDANTYMSAFTEDLDQWRKVFPDIEEVARLVWGITFESIPKPHLTVQQHSTMLQLRDSVAALVVKTDMMFGLGDWSAHNEMDELGASCHQWPKNIDKASPAIEPSDPLITASEKEPPDRLICPNITSLQEKIQGTSCFNPIVVTLVTSILFALVVYFILGFVNITSIRVLGLANPWYTSMARATSTCPNTAFDASFCDDRESASISLLSRPSTPFDRRYPCLNAPPFLDAPSSPISVLDEFSNEFSRFW